VIKISKGQQGYCVGHIVITITNLLVAYLSWPDRIRTRFWAYFENSNLYHFDLLKYCLQIIGE